MVAGTSVSFHATQPAQVGLRGTVNPHLMIVARVVGEPGAIAERVGTRGRGRGTAGTAEVHGTDLRNTTALVPGMGSRLQSGQGVIVTLESTARAEERGIHESDAKHVQALISCVH